ncbi:MAG: hypothetical protein QG673_309 [Pseudomonadota bacterium]|nr:hypothetical protein [Pseudomonadota bacterium]
MSNEIELQPVESSPEIESNYRDELLTFFSSGIFLFDSPAINSHTTSSPATSSQNANSANNADNSIDDDLPLPKLTTTNPIKLQIALTEYYSNDKLKKMTKRLFDKISAYHKAEFDSQIDAMIDKKIADIESTQSYQDYTEQLQFMNYTVTKNLRDDFIYSIILAVLMQGLFNTPHRLENQIITDAVNKINERIEIISSDQSIKITQGLTMAKCKALDLNQYKWQTMQDKLVRPTHAANNKKIFNWDNPPEQTGHPGTQVNCRCKALVIASPGMANLLNLM